MPPSRVASFVIPFLLAACAAGRRGQADQLKVLDASPEQARVIAIEVLEEYGLRTRLDDEGREIVGTTGAGLLRGEAQRLVTCPRARGDRAAFTVLHGTGGYGTTGTFKVRVVPRDGGVRLFFDARFQAPACPPVDRSQRPWPMCATITCESTGILERRIVEQILAEA